jgi:hypothetical protein
VPYYYADCFTEEDGSRAPGQVVDGELVSGLDVIPPRCRTLRFDESLTPERFVMELHPDFDLPMSGWTSKTAEEIEADYPGIFGGV